MDEKVPSHNTNVKAPAKKKTAADMTVPMTEVTKKPEPKTVDEAIEDKNLPKGTAQDKEPEPFVEAQKGKHRHQQHQDKKDMKKQGFLKQVFRRKSGE